MVTTLLVSLVFLDIALLAAVMLLYRKQIVHSDLIRDLTEERQILSEMRRSMQEEIEASQSHSRAMIEKVTHLAAEAEQEVHSGRETLAKELESLASNISHKFEAPLKEFSKAQLTLESLFKRIDKEKSLLQKILARGEKICRFFDNRVPYEEILEELEDKKYSDARSLLAKGWEVGRVSKELGIPESEVRLVAGLAQGL